jgi:hypothetical protein
MSISPRLCAGLHFCGCRGAFGHACPDSLKLDYLQVSGLFKARAAFSPLISGPVSEAGVAAASVCGANIDACWPAEIVN